MARSIKIRISAKWGWVEATGRKCSHCGDACYMRERRIMIKVGRNGKPNPLKKFRLCQSCGEAIESIEASNG